MLQRNIDTVSEVVHDDRDLRPNAPLTPISLDALAYHNPPDAVAIFDTVSGNVGGSYC